jgi:hypothetical protein
MRKVVTGEQVAQLHNRDPFAAPVWRSPVYRTPLGIVATVQATRVSWRLARFLARHVVMVLAAIAVRASGKSPGVLDQLPQPGGVIISAGLGGAG